jgi:hypothetical protein
MDEAAFVSLACAERDEGIRLSTRITDSDFWYFNGLPPYNTNNLV